MNQRERAARRRARMAVHRAGDYADAEDWDLRFWQAQSPEARLDALVEIHEDVARVEAAKAEGAGHGRREAER